MRTFTMAAAVALGGFVSCNESVAHAPAVAPVTTNGEGYLNELRPAHAHEPPRAPEPDATRRALLQ